MALTKSLSFSLGRKRILISNDSCTLKEFSADFESFAPLKRRCSGIEIGDEGFQLAVDDFEPKFSSQNHSSLLEALPQEILIKVVCGVDHEDLKQLYEVSRTIRDAAKIAKKSHFAYSTPSKTKVFRNSIDLVNDNQMDMEEYEAPNAPKQARRKNRPRISEKKLEDISVNLFGDDEKDEQQQQQQRWPRRSLFM